jgi:hypothetical protein
LHVPSADQSQLGTNLTQINSNAGPIRRSAKRDSQTACGGSPVMHQQGKNAQAVQNPVAIHPLGGIAAAGREVRHFFAILHGSITIAAKSTENPIFRNYVCRNSSDNFSLNTHFFPRCVPLVNRAVTGYPEEFGPAPWF